MNFKKIGFSSAEILLWSVSTALIIISSLIFDSGNYLSLIASVIGVTSLILNAKGDPVGQILMIVFSVMYGIVSFSCAYYGEMITYLGMTAPMALIAFIAWVRNPFSKDKREVKVNTLKFGEILFMLFLTVAVTVLFYFILKRLGNANIVPSTISVSTSFVAVYLTFRRSRFFPLAYAANDIILIVLWALASLKDKSYLSVLICFTLFLANDIYGFISWSKMKKRQYAKE